MQNSFLPDLNSSGVTESINAAVGAASVATKIRGPAVLISVGSAAGLYMRFGRANTTAVDSSNGFFRPAGSTIILSVPAGCTHILHIREAVISTGIFVLPGVGGT